MRISILLASSIFDLKLEVEVELRKWENEFRLNSIGSLWEDDYIGNPTSMKSIVCFYQFVQPTNQNNSLLRYFFIDRLYNFERSVSRTYNKFSNQYYTNETEIQELLLHLRYISSIQK